MPTVLEDLKQLLEVDLDEEIYDNQLLLYANGGLRYLMNNAVPVSIITKDTEHTAFANLKDDDYQIVLSWLNLHCLRLFDRTLMNSNQTATNNWIEAEMQNLIYQLKVIYDRTDSGGG